MTESEKTAWAAGIFEGEGYVGLTRQGARRGERGYQTPMMQVGMTDGDVVRRFAEIARVGSLTGPHQRSQLCQDGSPRKPDYRWGARGRPACLSLARRLLPYMGDRRRAKMIEVLPGLLDAEFEFPEELVYLEDVL